MNACIVHRSLKHHIERIRQIKPHLECTKNWWSENTLFGLLHLRTMPKHMSTCVPSRSAFHVNVLRDRRNISDIAGPLQHKRQCRSGYEMDTFG